MSKTTNTPPKIELKCSPDALNTLQTLQPVATHDALPATPDQAKRALKLAVAKAKSELRDRIRAKAEEALQKAPVRSVLAAHGFYLNAPEGTLLAIHNAAKPRTAVDSVACSLGEDFKFLQVGLLDDIDPEPVADAAGTAALQPVDPICATIADHARGGVLIHLMATIASRPFAEQITFLAKNSLLGTQTHRESVQVFHDRVFDRASDPNAAVSHSPIGHLLGRRVQIDSRCGVGEPMHGERRSESNGAGPIGALRGVQIAPPPGTTKLLGQRQRETLATYGLNSLRCWKGVGNAVVDSNRSLLGSEDSVYIFTNCVRLRSLLQATFHATAESEVLGTGRRAAGPLEKTAGLMTALLERLKQDGRVEEGRAVVDYEALEVKLSVTLKPVTPVDTIQIEYSETSFNESH